MSGFGFIERMKGWFGGKRAAHGGPAAGGKRYTLGPPDGDTALSLAGAGAAAAGMVEPAGRFNIPAEPIAIEAAAPVSSAEATGNALLESSAACPPGSLGGEAAGRFTSEAASGGVARPTRLDPLDPVWMQSLEELPARIAESVARSAAGVRMLENIGAELEGHRQATRTIADSMRRLPDLAAGQSDLLRQANKTLERQAVVEEATLDAITDLRAALRTVEESSRRHLKAIAQLEYGHRQILGEYQEILLGAHRRLGRMATLGVLLAALALGGVGYALYLAATIAR
jgi:hypothetical protein